MIVRKCDFESKQQSNENTGVSSGYTGGIFQEVIKQNTGIFEGNLLSREYGNIIPDL